MGKIHIVALFVFVLHVSFCMEIEVGQNYGWTKVKGMESYELLSDALSIFFELLLNVCTTIIKLFTILACMITTCIDLFTKMLAVSVIYVVQSSSGALQRITGLVYTC